MKAPIAKVWKLLQSRNLALVLLAVVLIAVILAWLFRLNQVLLSWPFLTALALLLLNTLACSITRISSLLNKAGREPDRLGVAQISTPRHRAELQTRLPLAKVLSAVKATLGRRGYRTAGCLGDKSSLFAEKGVIGEWGSVIFHLSFLVILLGVIISGLTRYVGIMVIAEGQTITEQRQDYLTAIRVPPVGERHQGFQVRLDDFQPTYYQGRTGTDFSAHLTVLENERQVLKEQVRVNQPLVYQGTTFLLERYGFAPRFVLTDATGQPLFDSFVNLRVLAEGSEDSFTIPGTGLAVTARLYPDMIMVDGQMRTQSLWPDNPVMSLVIDNDKEMLFEGPVPLGDAARFDGKSLSFTELRYWTQYRVVKDAGQAIIFGSFWLGAAGLAARYLFIQKRLWVTIVGSDATAKIVLSGSASQFDSLYAEEFAGIVARMGSEVEHGAE